MLLCDLVTRFVKFVLNGCHFVIVEECVADTHACDQTKASRRQSKNVSYATSINCLKLLSVELQKCTKCTVYKGCN